MQRSSSPTANSSIDAHEAGTSSTTTTIASTSTASNTTTQSSRSIVIAERRKSYRLFPIVDPTPPASPILQKAKPIGTHRRRSSSFDQHHRSSRASTTAVGHATPSAVAALRAIEGRKGSLPDIRPLQALDDHNNVISNDIHALPARPSSAGDRALGGATVGDRSNSITADSLVFTSNQETNYVGENSDVVSSHGLASHFPSATGFLQGRRVRSRPNLRIAVGADRGSNDEASMPPSKSARHAHGSCSGSQQETVSKTTGAEYRLSRPFTPSVMDRPPMVTAAPSMTGPEPSESPPSRKRAVKGAWRKMQGLQPRNDQDDSLVPKSATFQPQNGTFGDLSVRPQTSDGPRTSASIWRNNIGPPPQRQPPPTPVEPRYTAHINTRQSRWTSASSKSSNRSEEATPATAQVQSLASHAVREVWNDLPAFRSGLAQRSVDAAPRSSRHENVEAATSEAHRVSVESSFRPSNDQEYTTADEVRPDPPSNASLALAAARANVAALVNSNAIIPSPGFDNRSRSSGSDIGASSAGFPRSPYIYAATDPVETLKDLSDQVDALHAKYASLKAERQQISSAIITALKEQTFGPESVNILLDQQLSLAATSSSLDICLAKLKSLECRKEDAIAALIARSTASQRSPADNIPAMIASMALSRKPSWSRSADSMSRYGVNGRSTPDLRDSSSSHRLTQPSTRTFSYSSEPENLDYRRGSLSRQQSNASDSYVHTESSDRQTPETIPESPEQPRTVRLETSRALNQMNSDSTTLSPVFENHSKPSLLEAALDRQKDEHSPAIVVEATSASVGRESSFDSIRTVSSDELFDEQPRPLRVNTTKAAQILGIRASEAASLIHLPLENKAAFTVTQVEVDDRPTSPSQGPNTSPSTIGVEGHNRSSNVSPQSSPDVQDFDDQLKSFPRPNSMSLSASLSTNSSRRFTGGSFLTNGSSAESSPETDDPIEPVSTRRPQKTSSTKSRDLKKREPSAHTIQVYMDHDEIMEYWNSIRH